MNNINEVYKLNSILDIYDGTNNHQTIDTAHDYYINHNSIPNGIILSDKMVPINNMHQISNTYYYYENNLYSTNAYNFVPLLINKENSIASNNYKLLSSKDIDYENAYLKYVNQQHDYNKPIEYYGFEMHENNNVTTAEPVLKTNSTYIFNREITPYINNSYDLLNIIDYLCNRVNALYFLVNVIKEQRNISNNSNN